MAIPTKGLSSLRTLSGGRVDRRALQYRIYLQITCLEMEKARRDLELRSVRQRVLVLDARLEQIEKAKQELLQALAAPNPGPHGHHLPAVDPKPLPRRSTGGFKVRY